MKHLLVLSLVAAILVLSSCRQEETLFEKLKPHETNIIFENTLEEESLFNSVNYLYFYDGGGVAVGDVNNDGLADIYLTANAVSNRLYLNKGNFQFEDVTESADVGGGSAGWSTGAVMADINGDGFLDIYVCRSTVLDRQGPNQLFINNGDLTFSEKGAEYGLAHTGLSRQAAFFDYDLDGDLDMYLLNHSIHSKNTYRPANKLRDTHDAEAGDKLYRNENGRFVDVTADAGIYNSALGYGLGIAVGDINSDGYPDIYISNDFHEDDYLYYNNGDGTFTEAMRNSMGHISSASMGNDLADFNNDGLLDLVVLDMLPEKEEIRQSSVTADAHDISEIKLLFGYYHQVHRNTLQLNRGPEPGGQSAFNLFSEIGPLAGVHATDWSWSPLFVDLDNDGYKDLFISNGIYLRPNDLDYLNYIKQNESRVKSGGRAAQRPTAPIEKEMLAEIVAQMPSVPLSNYVFHSQGDLRFVNRAAEWGLGDPGFSSGAAYADFDNDGDMDLVVNNVNAPAAIYKNLLYQKLSSGSFKLPEVDANYLKIKLTGSPPNRFGVGAKVTLHSGEKILLQELSPTRGFQSSVEPVLNFGLGEIDRLDSLQVIWPTGEYQVLADLPVNQTITLNQTDATARFKYPSRKNERPLFRNVTKEVELKYRHQENKFVEFNREPFIPHFLSTEGPAVAIADVNADGLEDLYLGGARRQPGHLFLQKKQGGFKRVDSPFQDDAMSEDVDAVFFDANGDNLPDLYIVSGGNELFGQAEALRDRLYLNEGKGKFRKTDGMLPELYANGACVKPVDIDKDGDVDLFVGSRSVPRLYGVIPESYLLMNDGKGKFTDETAFRAPGSSKIGMVTDAVWVDLNQDTYPDLIVVGEWMPITLFHNLRGELVNVTEKYGLQTTHGWWNTLTMADVNQDGFVDLVAGNLGLNSILKTAVDKPVQLFIHDFSGNGKLDQILTYFHAGKAYPVAPSEQMFINIPSLRTTYPTYADYAGKSLQDIFSREQIETATVRTATEFASILLMNNGDETFELKQLPVEAQFSPLYAILIDDFNEDGNQDMLLGGNFSGVPPDQGKYDASYGSLLLGDGAGNFTSVSSPNSGFAVSGEVRQIKSLKMASGETLIIAVRNNDTVGFFKQMKTKTKE